MSAPACVLDGLRYPLAFPNADEFHGFCWMKKNMPLAFGEVSEVVIYGSSTTGRSPHKKALFGIHSDLDISIRIGEGMYDFLKRHYSSHRKYLRMCGQSTGDINNSFWSSSSRIGPFDITKRDAKPTWGWLAKAQIIEELLTNLKALLDRPATVLLYKDDITTMQSTRKLLFCMPVKHTG
eukprot:GILJ01016508.1.p1 GENE.GILJ01016508.1~~GILJ01016508.1.p1  ORF type:complete len:180 (+),score=17.62 GILJ01016508.1:333-872(+)